MNTARVVRGRILTLDVAEDTGRRNVPAERLRRALSRYPRVPSEEGQETGAVEWFCDQVYLPLKIRIFVSSAVSSYLRSYLRLETAKSMAVEARAATSARSRRAPER